MIPIHFQAVFLPGVRKFRVHIHIMAGPAKGRWVELMTIARFLRWAKSAGPIRIGGVTINFGDSNPEAIQQIRDYFKLVADSYIAAKYKKEK